MTQNGIETDLERIKSQIIYETGVSRIQPPKLDKIDNALLYFQNIGDEMLNANKRYSIEKTKDCIEKMIKWAYMVDCGLDFNKGILLKGKTGRGKSMIFKVFRLFLSIDNLQYKENGDVKMLIPRIVNVMQISGEYQDAENGGYKTIEKYGDTPCLMIDDIGREQDFSSNFGNKINIISEIIRVREEKGLLTFGTTNIDKMNDKYDDRTVSRMYALFNVLPINHKIDFRKQ